MFVRFETFKIGTDTFYLDFSITEIDFIDYKISAFSLSCKDFAYVLGEAPC